MIKVRLLVEKFGDWAKLLDEAVIPDIDSKEDLKVIINTCGQILKPYVDQLQDPNVVSVALDRSVTNWTINDLQSIQYLLTPNHLKLMVTHEDDGDTPMTEAQVKFIMVDSSEKFLGIIPEATTQLVDKKDVYENNVKIIYDFVDKYDLFNPSKFVQNPLKTMLENAQESLKLLGTFNPYAMSQVTQILNNFDKRIYAMTIENV